MKRCVCRQGLITWVGELIDLWVVNGERVEKRKVMLGESGFEYVEVLQGIDGRGEGDYFGHGKIQG